MADKIVSTTVNNVMFANTAAEIRDILNIPALSSIVTLNNRGKVPISQTQGISIYNVSEFNASGSRVTTSGSISSGSSVLTVTDIKDFKVGQGVLIIGAGGTLAGHLVASIVSIQGNQFTLNSSATVSVVGAVIHHDDTTAINNTIAACVNAKGGEVKIPLGYYKCNKSLDPRTKSVITFPDTTGYNLYCPAIKISGSGRGSLMDSSMEAEDGGTVIDFSLSIGQSGQVCSGLSPAAYVDSPGFGNIFNEWAKLGVHVDDILFVFAPNPSLHGLMFKNTLRASVGDGIGVIALAGSPPDGGLLSPGFTKPNYESFGTVGIYFPAALNNIELRCGAAWVMGFGTGIIAGEHIVFDRPSVSFCNTGVLIPLAGHKICGTIAVENCLRVLQISGTCALELEIQCELSALDKWYKGVEGIYDPGNQATGSITYACYDANTGGGNVLPFNGCGGVQLINKRSVVNSFSKFISALQSIPSVAETKVTLSGNQFDCAGSFNSTTSRWTPNAKGWYILYAAARILAAPPNTYFGIWLKKNSSENIYFDDSRVGGSFPSDITRSGTKPVYMNGTTDYLEMYAFQDSGSPLNLQPVSTSMAAFYQQVPGF